MAHSSAGDDYADYTDPFSLYGKAIIEEHHDSFRRLYSQRPPPQLPDGLPDVISRALADPSAPASEDSSPILSCSKSAKIGIIGAGVGGLYAAMMLQSLGIDFEILEASERVGGRLYTQTYGFSQNKYDYFDVGAMRFPDTPMMKRTFHLFNKLETETDLRRVPYIFTSKNSTLLYNGVLKKRGAGPGPYIEDPREWNIPDIPPQFAGQGWSALVHNVVDPFVQQLAHDFETRGSEKTGWKLMMQYDQYSTRAYMSSRHNDAKAELDKLGLMPYPLPVINWLETFDTSTAAYDRALSEAVLESLAFSFPRPEVEWWCIDGGSQVIAEKMVQSLHKLPITKTRVKTIALHLDSEGPDPKVSETWREAKVKLSFADGSTPRTYDHVISTVTLPCLRAMDLSQAGLTVYHKTALRELRYGPAVKIGVKFKMSWWTDSKLMKKYQQPQYNFGPIYGGQSNTDRMVRCVVYPSYGGQWGGEKSTVLIVSYCWTEDANRWSALVGERSKEELKDIVLRDLVAVHGFSEVDGYKFLVDQWMGHFAWSWSDQPDFMGAFGFFGPGQFSYVYKHMTQPAAAGRLHFAGESLSTRHAWVVGALDASWRAVYEILWSSYPDKVEDFERMWGSDEDWTQDIIARHVCFSLAIQGINDAEHRDAGPKPEPMVL